MSRSDPPAQRTPEEREAARREREARRAARTGRKGERERDGGPPGREQPAPPVFGRARTPGTKRERPKLPRPSLPKAPSLRLPGRREREVEQDPHAPPLPPPLPAGAGATVPPPEADPSEADPPPELPREPFGGGSEGSADGAAPPRPPASRFGRGRAIVAGLAAVLVIAVGWFMLSLFQPFAGEGEGRLRVVIPAGSSVGQVADVLEQRGVIDSAFFFELRAAIAGKRGDLKQGTFALRRDMSYSAALDALTSAPPANVVNVTVPEGRSRREVAPVVKNAGLNGNYARASRRSRILNPRAYGARGATSLEGFLFPSTYELKKSATATTLVNDQLRTFKREFRRVDLRSARRRNLTPYDVLIIASMVDREALLARERPIVASVIYNRLKDGIPLGIDATIRFATNNWARPLRQSELAIASPYNTRENAGLPPGPIGSPGLEAIRAAANPAKTKFLYYVVKPGRCGEHAFSTTDAQFQRDVARYNSEREARGGKSPDTCPE